MGMEDLEEQIALGRSVANASSKNYNCNKGRSENQHSFPRSPLPRPSIHPSSFLLLLRWNHWPLSIRPSLHSARPGGSLLLCTMGNQFSAFSRGQILVGMNESH
jgi:hypothetical protein